MNKLRVAVLCVAIAWGSASMPARDILLTSPGTLANEVADNSVSELTIAGVVDVRDFDYISSELGALRRLDLSQAEVRSYSSSDRYFGNNTDFVADAIPAMAFAFSGVETVILPRTLREIGDGAFAGCGALKSIDIPATVTRMGEYSFASCTALERVTLPDGLVVIPSKAFEGCRALVSVNMPKQLTAIASEALRGTAIATLDASGCKLLSAIDDYACADCGELISATLPEGLSTIGTGAFYGCRYMAAVELPQSVCEVSDVAYMGCSNAWKVTMSSTDVEYIGNSAFRNMKSLERFTINTEKVPALGDEVWYGVTQSEVRLAVPENAISDYAAASQWKEFRVTPLGVNSTVADDATGVRYKLCGKQLTVELASGNIGSVAVTDMMGRTVALEPSIDGGNSIVVDLSACVAGVYVVALSSRTAERVAAFKIILKY